jgi:hypothetical protein
VQGRWGASSAVAFSGLARARKVAATGSEMVSGPHFVNVPMLSTLSMQDALEIEYELTESAVMPGEWQEAEARGSSRGLDLTLLMHDSRDGLVAHLLSFTVPLVAISYTHRPAYSSSLFGVPGLGAQGVTNSIPLSDFWTAPLPARFVAHVDTLAHPTRPGCGKAAADGTRKEVSWLGQVNEVSFGDFSAVALEITPLALGVAIVSGVPHLTSVKLRIGHQMDARGSTGPLAGSCITMPLQVSQLEEICTGLEWA